MTFAQSILIAAPPGALFALTQDYARRLAWDPFLRSAELLDGSPSAGVGVRALCVAHNGLGMETEYVSFNPPHTCAVKMTRGPRLLDRFAGSWRFDEVSPGQTRVTFSYHLRPAALAVVAPDTARRLGVCARHAQTARRAQGGG